MSDFTILVLDGALDTSVGATLDLLGAARTLSARAKTPAPRWRLVSPDGGDVKLKSGLVAQTQKLGPHRQADPSLWIVPGIGLESESAVMALPSQRGAQAAMGALSSHQARGGRMAISCSSVFLPAFAGLLSGRQVTTCWWLAPLMQRHFPDIKVDAARMVVADGNLVTAGAAFAQIDLMLHVLREKGLIDPVHKHMDHETVAYLIKGRLRLVIGGEEFIAEAGTSWIHPRGVEHFSEALEDCEQLEIKSPPRKTWTTE